MELQDVIYQIKTYLAIEVNPVRLGRCDNCNHEIPCTSGYRAIAAWSFTDLLKNRVHAPGDIPGFWVASDFVQLGGAYDD